MMDDMAHGGEDAMSGEQPPSGQAAGRGPGRGPERPRHQGLLAGRYRLGDHLGDGALGTVWQATDELVGREVAVKEPRLPATLPATERARAYDALRHAVRAATRIEHPCVITVHDVLTVEGRPWVVMELIRGDSLAATLRRATLGVRQVAHIGLAVASALRAAHTAGITHGDVTPGNILLGRGRTAPAMVRPNAEAGTGVGVGAGADTGPEVEVVGAGRVVLTDFGMVHAVDQAMPGAGAPARLGAVGREGTAEDKEAGGQEPAGYAASADGRAAIDAVQFIAPERLGGTSAAPEPAADLWALGVVLYLALEGVTPYRRDTQAATLAAVLGAQPRPPVRTGPLTELVGRLLAREPAARPGAEEVEAALRTVAAALAPPASSALSAARSQTALPAAAEAEAGPPGGAPTGPVPPRAPETGAAEPPQRATGAQRASAPRAAAPGARQAGSPSSMDTLQLRALDRGSPEPKPGPEATRPLPAQNHPHRTTDQPSPTHQPSQSHQSHQPSQSPHPGQQQPTGQPTDDGGPPAPGCPDAHGGPAAPDAPGGPRLGRPASDAPVASGGRTAGPPDASPALGTGRPSMGHPKVSHPSVALPGALPAAVPMPASGRTGAGGPVSASGPAPYPSARTGRAVGDAATPGDGGAGAGKRGPLGSVRPKVALGALGALVLVVGAGVFLIQGPLSDDAATAPPAASAEPSSTASSSPTGAPTPTPTAPSAQPGRPALPAGWRLQAHEPLTASVPLPNGYRLGDKNDTEANWTGGDKGAFTIGLKRDTGLGATAAEASEKQITWYRTTKDSSMEDVHTRRHSIDWYGAQARWIELDYRWRGKKEIRRRVELFVPGADHRVYQFFVDTTATTATTGTTDTTAHRAEQDKMFDIGRAQLRIDTPPDATASPGTPAASEPPVTPTPSSAPTTNATPTANATPTTNTTPGANTTPSTGVTPGPDATPKDD
ncbi:serine/threonine-protein kinase [Streptomyces zagrosensis]|uniref:non-specific serine/threonine protein kinase n=1 Tax=Streptomyces zagrosensis TaxID=1042984 RepID=A0A7W9QG28_9ACTN|nr:serine/threonine-protein kinase [Streptomyces zagrosensis]MBB5939626.1 serine/threonine protein kinase [Streptomyces zagrosensis]